MNRLFPEEYKEYGIIRKVLFYAIQLPCDFIVKICLPSPDEENWDFFYSAISPLFFLTMAYFQFSRIFLFNFLILVFKYEQPWILFVLLGTGLLYCVLTLLLTRNYAAPSTPIVIIHCMFATFISAVWVWFLCSFVVDMLDLIGFITELSSAFLGATFLAAGNSIGDFVADTSIANLNLLEMAITGTYSSPTFNLMVGLGTSLVIGCVQKE